jgi:hypothetical protein
MLEFTLESLRELDGGKAQLLFEQHVRRAALDCQDRPGDSAARKVTLTVTIKPVLQDDGDCSEVHGTVDVASAVPKHKTRAYSLGLRRGGKLVFNPDSLGNVNQATFLDGDDDGGDE